MPSFRHEGLLALFRQQPTLPRALHERAGGPSLATYDDIRFESADLNEPVPIEHRADLLLSLRRRGDSRPAAVLVVEVQLSIDPTKRYAWPAYVVQAYRRFQCAVYLLVIAPDRNVAKWSAQPIEVSPPDMVLRPEVVGPEQIPVITDVSEARLSPELATLSAIAHQRIEIAIAATLAAHPLDEERGRLYYDLIVSSLSEEDRSLFEEEMTQRYEYQSDFARKYYHEGRLEGEARGELRGRLEGEARGEAKAILAVLQTRGISVGADARRRIEQCNDLAQLDRWLTRVAHVSKDAELFDSRDGLT